MHPASAYAIIATLLRCCLIYYYYHKHFIALWILSGTTRESRYQKGKTNLDLLEQKTVTGSGMLPDLLLAIL